MPEPEDVIDPVDTYDAGTESTDEEVPTSVYEGLDGDDDTESKETPPKERKGGKRASAAWLIAGAWGAIGQRLVSTGTDVPVGRVMAIQAPLAGQKIDDALAYTWVDSLLQPLIKTAENVEGFGTVVAFPLLIGAYERNAALAPMLEPFLIAAVESQLHDLAELKRSTKRKQRGQFKSADLVDALGIELEPGQDPIQAVLGGIFDGAHGWWDTPMETQEEPSNEAG